MEVFRITVLMDYDNLSLLESDRILSGDKNAVTKMLKNRYKESFVLLA